MTWEDLWAKGTEVQEAAAAAVEAENERFRRMAARGAQDPRTGLSPTEAADALNTYLPYPFDPYDLEEIERVPSYFSWLAYRDPVELDGKAQALLDAYNKLANAYTSHSDTESGFTGFSGNFIGDLSGYLANMDKASDRQSELALELHTAILNAQQYLTKANEDLVTIADRAIDSLDDITDGGGGASDAVKSALVGMAIGAIGAGATGAGALGIAFAILSSGPAVLDAVSDRENVGSAEVDQVLTNMFDAIDDRREKLSSKEDELISGLNTDDGLVTEYHDILEPSRPGMADGRGDLAPDSANLVVNLAALRYYAQEDMPRMASDFADGNRAAARGFNAGGAAALDKVHDVWQGLCTRLQSMSGRTSQNIFDAADVVATAAADFARADGITADELAKAQRGVEDADSESDEYRPGDRVDPVLPEAQADYSPTIDRRTGEVG